MTKAEVKYKDGLILTISKAGNSMMLFLEFTAKFNAGANYIHKIINNETSFDLRLNTTKKGYQDCAKYINDNL